MGLLGVPSFSKLPFHPNTYEFHLFWTLSICINFPTHLGACYIVSKGKEKETNALDKQRMFLYPTVQV